MSRSGHSMLRSGRKSCVAASTQNVPRENTGIIQVTSTFTIWVMMKMLQQLARCYCIEQNIL